MKLAILIVLVSTAIAKPSKEEARDVLAHWETNCGQSRYSDAGREPAPLTSIVGGWDARRGEWPWQVSMRNAADSGNHYCGANIMNSGWVVTAAHCCQGELAVNVYVVVGEHDFDEDDTQNPFREVFRVSDVILHEDFGPATLVNDICLLKLTQNITFNENVQPACPPVDDNLYVGATGSLSGWGSVGNGPSPNILQTTNLPVITNLECNQQMQTVEPTWFITDDMICAGTIPNDDRDTCQGDSGGPLVTKNANERWELIGLTSWGYGCADGIPGVYHRVEYSLAWIDSKIYA